MHVPFWVWAITVAAILAMLTFDFFAHVRHAHEPTFKESATWSAIYIVIALLFGLGVGLVWDWGHGGDYFAGYLTEKSLSVDNLFVFLIIMTRFKVPRADQQKVLLVGVILALVFRTIFILLGAAALERWSWVFFIFGIFLLWTAWGQAKHRPGEVEEVHDNVLVKVAKRFLPATDRYDGDKLFTYENGRRMMTPMLLVMIAIGSTDVLFAVDSIPAIFGLTKEAYLVFAANAFALLGLRQLYFLIGGLLERLVYLSQGLAIILGFIGVKLILEALHLNELSFINGGQPVAWAPEIPTWLSLTVIGGTLVIVTIVSLLKTRYTTVPELVKNPPEHEPDEDGVRELLTAEPRTGAAALEVEPTLPTPDAEAPAVPAEPTRGTPKH